MCLLSFLFQSMSLSLLLLQPPLVTLCYGEGLWGFFIHEQQWDQALVSDEAWAQCSVHIVSVLPMYVFMNVTLIEQRQCRAWRENANVTAFEIVMCVYLRSHQTSTWVWWSGVHTLLATSSSVMSITGSYIDVVMNDIMMQIVHLIWALYDISLLLEYHVWWQWKIHLKYRYSFYSITYEWNGFAGRLLIGNFVFNG